MPPPQHAHVRKPSNFRKECQMLSLLSRGAFCQGGPRPGNDIVPRKVVFYVRFAGFHGIIKGTNQPRIVVQVLPVSILTVQSRCYLQRPTIPGLEDLKHRKPTRTP